MNCCYILFSSITEAHNKKTIEENISANGKLFREANVWEIWSNKLGLEILSQKMQGFFWTANLHSWHVQIPLHTSKNLSLNQEQIKGQCSGAVTLLSVVSPIYWVLQLPAALDTLLLCRVRSGAETIPWQQQPTKNLWWRKNLTCFRDSKKSPDAAAVIAAAVAWFPHQGGRGSWEVHSHPWRVSHNSQTPVFKILDPSVAFIFKTNFY